MVIKRKRSDSEISTASSLVSSPTASSNIMSIDSSRSPQSRISTPSLFPSRTRKRHRDNRPSEEEVHRENSSQLPSAHPLTATETTEHTLSMLYSAQQASQLQAPSPIPFQPQAPISSLPSSNGACQQSSLHSFWAIPSSTRQSSPSSNFSNSSNNTPALNSAMNQFFPATNCEDCDAPFNSNGSGDSMDIDMMDMDIGEPNHACTTCGKQVCHSCSVSNLGANRRCLNCAKPKKVWVGGLGWMDSA